MEREYIGVDLHKQFFQVCAIGGDGARRWEGRFPRTDGGLTMFHARCTTETAIAVEASGPTWSFVDALQPTGATVCVVDPRKTRLKAGYAAKTDRLDARRLADALRRESVVSIYVPPVAVRELREVCRTRHHLVRLRTRVAQMIRALLLRHGAADVPVRRVFSVRARAWLDTVLLPPDTRRHSPGCAGSSMRSRPRWWPRRPPSRTMRPPIPSRKPSTRSSGSGRCSP
jgi:transposase